MPNKDSAKKALRQAIKRTKRNINIKVAIKSMGKKAEKAISSKKIEDATKALNDLKKSLAKAAQKGVIKKNTASRKTSRMQKLLNKALKK